MPCGIQAQSMPSVIVPGSCLLSRCFALPSSSRVSSCEVLFVPAVAALVGNLWRVAQKHGLPLIAAHGANPANIAHVVNADIDDFKLLFRHVALSLLLRLLRLSWTSCALILLFSLHLIFQDDTLLGMLDSYDAQQCAVHDLLPLNFQSCYQS